MGCYCLPDLHDAYYSISIGDAIIGKSIGWKIQGVSKKALGKKALRIFANLKKKK